MVKVEVGVVDGVEIRGVHVVLFVPCVLVVPFTLFASFVCFALFRLFRLFPPFSHFVHFVHPCPPSSTLCGSWSCVGVVWEVREVRGV